MEDFLETTSRTIDDGTTEFSIISANSGSSSFITDPFDQSLVQLQVAARMRLSTCEITTFDVDASILIPVSLGDVSLETLSEKSRDILHSLSHLSPALAALKKK